MEKSKISTSLDILGCKIVKLVLHRLFQYLHPPWLHQKKKYFDKDLDELRFVLNQMASYAYCDRTQNLGLSFDMHVLETLSFKHTHDIRP